MELSQILKVKLLLSIKMVPANVKSVVISTQHSKDVNQSQVRELVKPYIERSIPKEF